MTQVKDKHIPRIFNFSYIWCCEMINENNNLMTSKWHDNLKCKYEQLDVFFVSCEHCRKEYKPLTLVILFFFGLHTRMLSQKCVILWLLSLQIFTQMDFLALSVNIFAGLSWPVCNEGYLSRTPAVTRNNFRLSSKTLNIYINCRTFGSWSVTYCFNDLGRWRPGFEHLIFCMRDECSNQLRYHCNCN